MPYLTQVFKEGSWEDQNFIQITNENNAHKQGSLKEGVFTCHASSHLGLKPTQHENFMLSLTFALNITLLSI